jgi:4-hydroxybenzoyl-CoA thioesterase
MFYKEKLIRFQHCDPAGIVFYPQYLILFHELMEDWFNEGLDEDYAALILQRKMGFPIVKLEVEFMAPNTMGAILGMRLEVKHIGASSLTLAIAAGTSERECIRATLKVVHTSLDKLKAEAIPAELRASMLRFQKEAA